MNHPALPKNPTLWKLHAIHDSAQRWLDHAETRKDFEEIEEFIYEVELKICEFSQTTEHLQHCFEATFNGK